jgi:lipoyl(octanoyl) transferase
MDGFLLEPADPGVQPSASAPAGIAVHWLGRVGYRDAWTLQKALAGARASGAIGDQLLLLEHPPVLTLGRGADASHVIAPSALLEARGIELLRVERGGEVTYHGPGQLVAYPIVRLADRELLLRPFVRALEAALVETCAAFGVAAERRDGHPGCWVDAEGPRPRKIGALGIRIERGTSYHGIALNVDVDLADFGLIDPCGMPGLDSTSIARETGRPGETPSTAQVAEAAAVFARAFAARIGAPLEGALPPDADPVAERAALDRLAAAMPVVSPVTA